MNGILLVITAFLIISTPMAFGQIINNPITVNTDRDTYTTGDTVMVNGNIQYNHATDISITVRAPNGNIVLLKQLTPNNDKSFEESFIIGGLFKFDGVYTIDVNYGSPERVDNTKFNVNVDKEKLAEILPETEPEPPLDIGTSNWYISAADQNLEYTISGADITNMTVNTNNTSIDIVLDNVQDGVITLIIPDTIMTADESTLFVNINDEPTQNIEFEQRGDTIIVTVYFNENTETISIMGSWVIPEFGAITGIILTMAIIPVILLSYKSKIIQRI